MIKNYKLFLENKGRNINDIIKERDLDLDIIGLNANTENLNSLEGIDRLNGLRKFLIGDNDLINIEGLSNLTNLEILWIYNNNLTSAKGIENLTELKYLYISDNNLTNIKFVKK